MAQGEESNNVAIIAIIVIAVLVAGAGFLYFRGDMGGPDTVIQRDTTVIEKQVPAPAAPAPKEEEKPGFSFEQTDESGDSTKIESN